MSDDDIDVGQRPREIFGGVASFLFNANMGKVVTKLFDWMRTATDEQIHEYVGKMSFNDAKTFRRLIEVMRAEGL